MKNKILCCLLIILILVRISLYYKLSIDFYSKYNFEYSVITLYENKDEIKAIERDKRLLVTEAEFLISELIILFFTLINKSTKVYYKILRVDKRKRIYEVLLSKIQGSMYKEKSLIL